MKNEFESRAESVHSEGYISDRSLVTPSLLPFLRVDEETKIVYKRNESLPETNRLKVSQKKIEDEFGSSVFINTARFLEEWSYLVRDNDSNLICPVDTILPLIFKKFNDAARTTSPTSTEYNEDLLRIPVFHKPNSLINAYADYQLNSDTLKQLFRIIESEVA